MNYVVEVNVYFFGSFIIGFRYSGNFDTKYGLGWRRALI
jgi:hypothetical protein